MERAIGTCPLTRRPPRGRARTPEEAEPDGALYIARRAPTDLYRQRWRRDGMYCVSASLLGHGGVAESAVHRRHLGSPSAEDLL